MREYRIPLHIPVVPLRGEHIDGIDGTVTDVGARFARWRVGEDRFAVQATNDRVYEVVPVTVDGRRRWRAVGETTFDALSAMGPSETTEVSRGR